MEDCAHDLQFFFIYLRVLFTYQFSYGTVVLNVAKINHNFYLESSKIEKDSIAPPPACLARVL
jgi:hypothetical protein